MAGNYSETVSTGVRDPLSAKAMYCAQGDTAFCIVVCDVCGHERGLTDAARERAAKRTGISAKHIVFTATHTHGGPMHYDPVLLAIDRAKQGAKDDATDPRELGGYRKNFPDKLADAVVQAKANAKPATLSHADGRAPGVAFNRRYHMKNGAVRFNPGKLNADILEPAGPTDDRLPLLLARDAGGKPFGSLCAFAMHTAVYGGRAFSADYPADLQTELRTRYGDGFLSVFGEGCAGDVNHVDVRTKQANRTPAEIGAKLATAFRDAKPVPVEAALAVAIGEVNAPLRDDRPLDLPTARKTLGNNEGEFLDQVEAYRLLLVKQYRDKHDDAVPLAVRAFKLGADAAIVALPHEIFVEHGLAIRQASPFATTLVISLADEVDCYVPTRKAFGEGSYEVTNSPYKAGVGELLVAEAVRLLKTLK